MNKAEEGKEVAVKAIVEGDYEFAADIMVSVELQKLKDKGLTEGEALNLLSRKLEREGYSLELEGTKR